MHSATKFISGHSDLMAGVLAIKGERFVYELHIISISIVDIFSFTIEIINFLYLLVYCFLGNGFACIKLFGFAQSNSMIAAPFRLSLYS